MENQTCQNCEHFRQHYGLDESGFFRVHCGHCTHCRIITKKPHQKACPEFVQTENAEAKFVSKRYLSKTLLDWIRQLELMPEIREEEIL